MWLWSVWVVVAVYWLVADWLGHSTQLEVAPKQNNNYYIFTYHYWYSRIKSKTQRKNYSLNILTCTAKQMLCTWFPRSPTPSEVALPSGADATAGPPDVALPPPVPPVFQLPYSEKNTTLILKTTQYHSIFIPTTYRNSKSNRKYVKIITKPTLGSEHGSTQFGGRLCPVSGSIQTGKVACGRIATCDHAKSCLLLLQIHVCGNKTSYFHTVHKNYFRSENKTIGKIKHKQCKKILAD